MSEQFAIVTGANAGLGYQTTLKLARRGYTVVMGCRSLERAAAAREQLRTEAPDATLEVIALDLSKPDSVQEFCGEFSARFGQWNLLVNNAGIVGVPLTRNVGGFELHLATNFLGPFALTGLLLPHCGGDRPSRIVNVGSLAHRFGKLPLDDLNWQGGKYAPMAAYARSKLAFQSFTHELSRRLAASGSQVIAIGAHPGFAATEIGEKTGFTTAKGPLSRWFNARVQPLIPSPDRASEATLLAACGEGVQNGDYYGPSGFLEISGPPGPAKVKKIARNVEAGKRLWALTEDITGVRFLSGL